MIRKISLSERDKENFCDFKTEKANNNSFLNVVVNKPWGYEYLMFQNDNIAIWMLYIKKGFSTSMHCHPKKKTSLLLISGEAVCSSLNEKFNLKEKDGLIFDKGVFHRTEALSENGIFVVEIETPNDKNDLFRLKDKYNREKQGYTKKQNVTDKTYNYHYAYLKDESCSKNFGKYKMFIRDYNNKNKNEIKNVDADIGVIISGEVMNDGRKKEIGDLININEIKNSNFFNIRVLFLKERKNLVRLSDYLISFLQKRGINDVFLVSGGNLMYLLESVRTKKMNFVANHHEQASAIAADGYARAKNKLGFSMVTSGPGGTNAVTGVDCAWIDSIPMLVISGQSYESQTIGNSGLRQLGVQETNIVDIVRPITKYAVMVKNPDKIKYHLEKALYLAESGRPGPVWLDIPINIQMAMIDEKELDEFKIPKEKNVYDAKLKEKVRETVELLKNAKRPVILLGNGVRLARAEAEFFKLAEKLSIPILTSRNANDLISEDNPLYAGRPGSFGTRAANFTIQNSDVLLSVGSRIGLALTGWAYNDFARKAKKIIVDIDENELKKKTIKADIGINADIKDFISEMLRQINFKNDYREWKEKIRYWKRRYPIVLPEYKKEEKVNTYNFVDILSDELNNNDIVVTDMGMSFQCTMQAFKIKKGQKLFTASGHAPMGYGLPAAIGACIANNKKRVICISGDGGLMMNIQELQTIKHYNLPVKLFIFNNNGYSSIRETQSAYFTGYIASEPSSGVTMPDFIKVADSYGIKSKRILNQKNLKEDIKSALSYPGPVIIDLAVSERQPVQPKQGNFKRPDGKTVPRPIEDMLPYLNREEFEREMIIEPVPFDPYKK